MQKTVIESQRLYDIGICDCKSEIGYLDNLLLYQKKTKMFQGGFDPLAAPGKVLNCSKTRPISHTFVSQIEHWASITHYIT